MAHMMRPLSGKRPITHHALVWVSATIPPTIDKMNRRRVRAVGYRIWPVIDLPDGLRYYPPLDGSGPENLEIFAEEALKAKKRLTLWITRGWVDFVLCGLSELMDAGKYVADWMSLDGNKVIVRGILNGGSVNTTSLGCFTGGSWDAWRRQCEEDKSGVVDYIAPLFRSEDERLAVWTMATCLSAAASLTAGPQRLSMGAQARSLWRVWLGPQLKEAPRFDRNGNPKKGESAGTFIAPLPSRPRDARQAERQCCYGLVREQYAHGRVDETVYAVDIQSAYLAGLVSMKMPVCYVGKVIHPTSQQLAERLETQTGCALVRLHSEGMAFPLRWQGKPARATGVFWTWLAGEDLNTACDHGLVDEVEKAYLWAAVEYRPEQVLGLMMMKPRMAAKSMTGHVAFWRSCYSALMGGFAQWRRVWVDEERPSPAGRWATWVQFDPKLGELVRYRSIAGRVQRRVDKGDAPESVPLVYANVTAEVRQMVNRIALDCPKNSLLAVCADCLWVTAAGLKTCHKLVRRVAAKGVSVGVRETFDQVWMDGRGRAVVQMDGRRFPVLTGVPTHSEVGPDGRSRWIVTEAWNAPGGPDRVEGVKIGTASFDAGKLVRENDYPLVWESPWLTINNAQMREDLLLPVDPRKGGFDL